MNSEEKQVVVALIEIKKDNRDRWTLFFAAVAAICTIVGLFIKKIISLQDQRGFKLIDYANIGCK